MCSETWTRELTERLADHDLHGDLGRRRDGVVGVGHETSVHAVGEGIARGIKGRLGDGVVLGEELKDNKVADGNVVQLVRDKDQASRATDSNGVRGTSSRGGCSLTLGDVCHSTITTNDFCRVRSSGNSLGDSDLFMESRGRGIGTRVGPDDDDLGASLRVVTTILLLCNNGVLVALGHMVGSREDVVEVNGHGKRRSSQSESRGELHIVEVEL